MEQFQFWRLLVFQMVRSRTSKQLRQRRQAFKTPPKTELIVCEGSKTEKMYFDKLKRRLRFKAVIIDVISPGESEPIAVVEEAISKKNEMAEQGDPYEKVWCVVDVEIPHHRTLDGAWEKVRKTDGIELILTNPIVEYWFLLHFKKHTAPFDNNDNVMTELKAVHPFYKKSRIGFDILYRHTATAIKNAKEVLEEKSCGEDLRYSNPSTNIHKLVEHLQNIA